MTTDHAAKTHSRGELAFMRFLASILLLGAALFGLGLVGSIGAASTGARGDIAMVPVVALSTWMLGWLGMRLWTGRSVPQWFISGFFGMLVVGSFGICLHLMIKGDWDAAMVQFAMMAPMSLAVRQIVFPSAAKPPAKKEWDDLA